MQPKCVCRPPLSFIFLKQTESGSAPEKEDHRHTLYRAVRTNGALFLDHGVAPISSGTFELVAAAKRCAMATRPKGETQTYSFINAGIMLDNLLQLEDRPRTLFDVPKGGPRYERSH